MALVDWAKKKKKTRKLMNVKHSLERRFDLYIFVYILKLKKILNLNFEDII